MTRRGARVRATLRAAAAVTMALAAGALPCAAQRPGVGMPRVTWPVRTREHVDLWLHGFAMIAADSSAVPLFRRDYRDSLVAARTRAGVVTDLDVHHDALARRLRENPALVNAQFLAFSFATWDDLVAAIDAFVKAGGDPKKARSREDAARFTTMARLFPTPADRDFARTMANSLQNEKDLFFHAWWVEEIRRRQRTLSAVDSLWQLVMRPRLQPFLDHSGQSNGELILAFALQGEGRTVSDARDTSRVAVGFPDDPAHAIDAIYAFVHEIVGPLTTDAVYDNTTPAEKRSGAANAMASLALVRGGALLFTRLWPALAPGYAAFYLHAGGVAYEGDPMAAFVRAFPIPTPMLESIDHQVAIALGGI